MPSDYVHIHTHTHTYTLSYTTSKSVGNQSGSVHHADPILPTDVVSIKNGGRIGSAT